MISFARFRSSEDQFCFWKHYDRFRTENFYSTSQPLKRAESPFMFITIRTLPTAICLFLFLSVTKLPSPLIMTFGLRGWIFVQICSVNGCENDMHQRY